MCDGDQVLAFVNTRLDRPSGLVDVLADPGGAARWLAAQLDFAPPSTALSPEEHRELLAFRNAARRLVQARSSGRAAPAGELAIVNRASADAPRADRLSADWKRTATFAASGSTRPGNLSELQAALANATIELVADATIDLAECAADDCVVLFVRRDPRRRWHSDRCGNRMRAARSYARRRGPPPQR